MFDILETVEVWLAEGRTVSLATVVDTWGSSPRSAGAKMAVSETMAMIGSVSGGCVETAVVQEALDSQRDGRPRLLNYGVSDDVAWDVGLACGGKISVFVELLDVSWWRSLVEGVREDQRQATVTIIKGQHTGQKVLVDDGGLKFASAGLPQELCSTLTEAARAALDQGQNGTREIKGVEILVDVFRPRPRLVIIGGAHVAMALQHFAAFMGFRVILIDPRKAFATKERFPEADMISHRYPDKVLPEIGLTPDTYLAVLTHDPKIDDPALLTALPSPVAYVGVLSSSRTHEKRRTRLLKAGLPPELLERIRTPIGIDINAKTPEEIALCIMAEIIAVRNRMPV